MSRCYRLFQKQLDYIKEESQHEVLDQVNEQALIGCCWSLGLGHAAAPCLKLPEVNQLMFNQIIVMN